jgi:2-iminobutanoate/2-iminopropanoate deaminase
VRLPCLAREALLLHLVSEALTPLERYGWSEEITKTIRAINPHDAHAPAGAYRHAISTHGAGRTLYISGQVGVDREGVLVEGFAGQAGQCWHNIIATLAADGMTANDLVKVTTFVTDASCAAELNCIRAPFLGDARPASTLVRISALMQPGWLIEVEAIAFKEG